METGTTPWVMFKRKRSEENPRKKKILGQEELGSGMNFGKKIKGRMLGYKKKKKSWEVDRLWNQNS